jgi:hypothetical protein
VVIVAGVVVAGTGGGRELLCDDGTGRCEFGGGVVDVVVFSESEYANRYNEIREFDE